MGAFDFLGFGNPYEGAPAVATADQNAYQVQGASNIQNSIGALQQYANGPGVSYNAAQSNADSGQQQNFINSLIGQANGTSGPSAAQQQMSQGLDSAVQQGRSVAQSVQALNPIAALQAASGNQALLQRQTIGQSAQLRAQEQLNAQQQLGSAMATQRSGDMQTAQSQLGAQQFNSQQQLSGLNSVLGGQTNLSQLQTNTAIAGDQARVNSANAQRQAYIDSRSAQLAANRGILTAALSTAGAVGGAIMTGGASTAMTAQQGYAAGANASGAGSYNMLTGTGGDMGF